MKRGRGNKTLLFFISGEHTNNKQTTYRQRANNKPFFKPLTTYGYKGL